MNRYHKLTALLLVMLCLWLPAGAVRAEEVRSQESVIIYDGADLLSSGEEQQLSLAAGEAAASMNWDIRIVTTDDAGGRSAQRYAEDFYMAHYHQDDGAAFLIDMDNREIYIATSGAAYLYLTDSRIEDLLDIAYEEVTEGRYARAFERMIARTQTYYESGVPAGQYTYNETTGETIQYQAPPSIDPEELLLSLCAGLAAFAAIFLGTRGKYKMKGMQYRYNLSEHSQTHVRRANDLLINTFMSHRRIPRNPPPSSGGGGHIGGGHSSTIHIGSGGHSFGGGGRKF